MNNVLGIMQGRLLPPYDGRFQAFPANNWRREFECAAGIGLQCIEFIYEVPYLDCNPLHSNNGIKQIKDVVQETGCGIYTICADYFMERRLFNQQPDALKSNQKALISLIERGDMLGVTGIVVPCVDQSELRTDKDKAELVTSLHNVLNATNGSKVKLYLETSLAPQGFRELLLAIDSPRVGVNFDSGNSAALGFDPHEEFSMLHDWINHIHIKDRELGGGTVPLGCGDTDFPAVFREMATIDYSGIIILQAARGGDEVTLARQNKAFVEAAWEVAQHSKNGCSI